MKPLDLNFSWNFASIATLFDPKVIRLVEIFHVLHFVIEFFIFVYICYTLPRVWHTFCWKVWKRLSKSIKTCQKTIKGLGEVQKSWFQGFGRTPNQGFGSAKPESHPLGSSGVGFVDFWGQDQKLIKIRLLAMLVLTSRVKARKLLNRDFWDWFCRLLGPRPENLNRLI